MLLFAKPYLIYPPLSTLAWREINPYPIVPDFSSNCKKIRSTNSAIGHIVATNCSAENDFFLWITKNNLWTTNEKMWIININLWTILQRRGKNHWFGQRKPLVLFCVPRNNYGVWQEKSAVLFFAVIWKPSVRFGTCSRKPLVIFLKTNGLAVKNLM